MRGPSAVFVDEACTWKWVADVDVTTGFEMPGILRMTDLERSRLPEIEEEEEEEEE